MFLKSRSVKNSVINKIHFFSNLTYVVSLCQLGVPGAQASPHIIRGSDLLAHNKGKNSDVDEWLKDAAEVLFLHCLCFCPWSL